MASPAGDLLDDGAWAKRKDQWLPSKDDGDFIAHLMTPVSEPGKFAGWIAPPKVGIDNKPGEFEYVKIAGRFVKAASADRRVACARYAPA